MPRQQQHNQKNNCDFCHRYGHIKSNCLKLLKLKLNKTKICDICNKRGHIKYQCKLFDSTKRYDYNRFNTSKHKLNTSLKNHNNNLGIEKKYNGKKITVSNIKVRKIIEEEEEEEYESLDEKENDFLEEEEYGSSYEEKSLDKEEILTVILDNFGDKSSNNKYHDSNKTRTKNRFTDKYNYNKIDQENDFIDSHYNDYKTDQRNNVIDSHYNDYKTKKDSFSDRNNYRYYKDDNRNLKNRFYYQRRR
jgi:hypothetical protein